MANANHPFSPDKRLIERQVKQGAITREQYRAYLDTLDEVSAKAVRLEPSVNETTRRREEREA